MEKENITDKQSKIYVPAKDNWIVRAYVPDDGSAVELEIPGNFSVFISEDGKPMIRRKADAEKSMSYESMSRLMYKDSTVFLWDTIVNKIFSYVCYSTCEYPRNCRSVEQAKRLIAFNKLQNVAAFLNEGWHPDFSEPSLKWFIGRGVDSTFKPNNVIRQDFGGVYFKTKQLALQAIGIMGEQSLSDLFNPNW